MFLYQPDGGLYKLSEKKLLKKMYHNLIKTDKKDINNSISFIFFGNL